MSLARIYSKQYLDWLGNLAAELRSDHPQRSVAAALGLIEVAFSRGVPVDDVPQVVDNLLVMLSRDLASARVAAWALFWLCGGNGQGRQDRRLRRQLTNTEAIQAVLLHEDLDSTVAVFLLAILKAEGSSDEIDSLGEQITPQLLRGLDHPDAVVRSNAIFAIRNADFKQAIEPLLVRVHDPDVDVRKNAVIALGEMGDSRALDPIAQKLADDSEDVVEAADAALSRLVDQDTMEMLVPILKHADPKVRQRVTRLLLRKGQEERVKQLAPEAIAEL